MVVFVLIIQNYHLDDDCFVVGGGGSVSGWIKQI